MQKYNSDIAGIDNGDEYDLYDMESNEFAKDAWTHIGSEMVSSFGNRECEFYRSNSSVVHVEKGGQSYTACVEWK